jgi:hypothetical protein
MSTLAAVALVALLARLAEKGVAAGLRLLVWASQIPVAAAEVVRAASPMAASAVREW